METLYMGEEQIVVKIGEKEKTYPAGVSFLSIAQEYQDQYEDDIVLALYNNRLRELKKTIKKDGELSFLTTSDKTGKRAYRRSVTLLMQKAVYNLWGREHIGVYVRYAIGQGYYCELMKDGESCKITETMIGALKKEMYRLVMADLPIEKYSMNTDEAVALFHELGMKDKEKLFRYRRSSRVNIYELDHYKDYFYGFMVPSTGYLRYYDVTAYQDGFVLLFPGKEAKKVPEFVPSDKLFFTLKRSRDWGKLQQIDTIGALNDAIAAGKTQEMILTQEALFEERIGALAEMIVKEEGKKFIMIAGPSSSGKTTFSHRLSIQLAAKGLKDILKVECPIDALDFDILGFIDHNITVNVIQNDKIVSKKELRLPKQVKNVIKCKNPRCITSIEQELDQIFILTDPEKEVYRCKYCEEKYTNPNRR